MIRSRPLRAVAACAACTTAVPAAFAAPADGAFEEVAVTGAFIRGTRQDATQPSEIRSRSDLDDVGNPMITEVVRNLNIANGDVGETNPFDASGSHGNEGATTINLRGLGCSRTHVLVNGRLHVTTSSIGVDISAVQSIATGRIEILEDGAAALFDSDAIAGVTNFLTRDDFEGIEVRASGQYLEESDGEYQLGAIFGGGSERLRAMGAIEYDRRSKLTIPDRDWAIQPLAANPQGGYSSIGQPGTVIPAVEAAPGVFAPNLAGSFADPECETVGGTVAGNPFTEGATTSCFFQFTQYDNLIEEQDTYRAFGELNYALTETVELHAEALYARMEMPDWNTSPSYPPQSLFGPDRYVPPDHPGLQDFDTTYPGVLPDGAGVFTQTRMTGYGGFLGEPEDGTRETDTVRIAAGLSGTLFDGELGFDVALSWSRRERTNTGPDMYVERMAFALDGLGGPDCDPATGTPGVGDCMFYTPFSNATAVSAVTGAINPNANPDLVAMNETLFPWLVDDLSTTITDELLVFDATFDGQLPVELPGGPVGWAFGLQARDEEFTLDPSDLNDVTVNPCPFNDPASVTLGNTDTLDCTDSTLTQDTGLFSFLAATVPAGTQRTIYGAFAELALPLTERLDAQLALRFEDYGETVGNTLDPKLALRFQATDSVVLRGSVSTTFRGPPQPFLEGRGTSLQFVGPAAAFKAVDTFGNPDLEPETAVASNLGIIFEPGNFYASLDYWRFDFRDPLQVEDFNAIVSAFSENGCTAGGTGVGTPVCNQLGDQIVFQPGAAGTLANLQRVRINYINGGDITTSGIDWLAQYDWETRLGAFTLGTQGTHTIEYEVDDFRNITGIVVGAGGDFAGNLNDNRNTLTPIVDLQGNLFGKWSRGRHRATLTTRYWGDYEDESAIAALQTIDDMLTVDLTYNLALVENRLNLNLSVFNLFDEDPPRAQTDLNYDPYTHSAFGRMMKLGLVYQL